MSHHERVSTGEGIAMDQKGFGQSSKTDIGDKNERQEKKFQPLDLRVPLYQAALKGDWQEATGVIAKYPDALHVPITEKSETALHIAAAAKHTSFVKELVKHLYENDYKLENESGQTALFFAAASGKVIIAEEMVKKNKELTLIRSKAKMTPLYIAALLGHGEMVSYLFGVTSFEALSSEEQIKLLLVTISKDLYDTALKILKEDKSKSLATAMDGERTALREFARKPHKIGSKSQLSVWEQCYFWFKGIYNKALMKTLARQLVEELWTKVRQLPDNQFSDHVKTFLFEAAEMGNVELLVIVIRSYPDLIWKKDRKGRSIFHIAVLNRQETVFNLIYELGAIMDMILTYVDDEEQNILHLAGQLAPLSRLNMVSGAALQMQRELLWFKEVERIVSPSYAQQKLKGADSAEDTPWDLFTKTHHDLKTRGEKWMKGTANYCMLVATLIATVVFTAAFTVPGGNTVDTGIPIFLKSTWFMVFFISDATALLCSSTSILMFLSILTSRYGENDFLVALPRRLLVGLTTLFMSIVGMLSAFSATCFLVYKSQLVWLPTVIIALAGVPIILFVLLHFNLWIDIIRSIYFSGFLFGHRNRLFSG